MTGPIWRNSFCRPSRQIEKSKCDRDFFVPSQICVTKKEGSLVSLTNTQYNEIMRIYQRRQLASEHDLEIRRREIYRHIPQMHELDERAGELGLNCARSLLSEESRENALSSFHLQMRSISKERERLLAQYGYPEDYLEPEYQCPDCKDTGYIGSEMCHCMREIVIDLYYTQSGLRSALAGENFGTFDLSCYPDSVSVPSSSESIRAHMKRVFEKCISFCGHFDTQYENLLFYGETGLGKTFLSHCIAGELLESGHSVMYYSAENLFRALGNSIFGRGDTGAGESSDTERTDLSLLYQCDLLIIDDLGTEMTNSFVASQLFRLINERMNARKSILISTNLSLSQLSQLYSERIMSRIGSGFTLLSFYGNDIRLMKKIGKHAAAGAGGRTV